MIDGERGTGWVFLVEYTENEGGKSAYTMSSKLDWRDVLNPSQFAVYDLRLGQNQQRPSGVRSSPQCSAPRPSRNANALTRIKNYELRIKNYEL